MRNIIDQMKHLFAGKWVGEGFARFPTIADTAYTEELEFIPNKDKDAIFFRQEAWYKNDTNKNGQTVFGDTGFILLKDTQIKLISVQIGGRVEMFDLIQADTNCFTFVSTSIQNDPISIRSQRIFSINNELLEYKLNMETSQAAFQNHLNATLRRITINE